MAVIKKEVFVNKMIFRLPLALRCTLTFTPVLVMAMANYGKVGFTFEQLSLMLGLGRLWRLLWLDCKVINRFINQIFHINALALASLQSLLSKLVSFLAVLIDEPESFFILFIVLK